MVASAEPAADLPGVGSATAFEGEEVMQPAAPADPFAVMGAADVPPIGPIVPDKPIVEPIEVTPVAMNNSAKWVSAYASERVEAAYGVSGPFKAMGLTEGRIKKSWKESGTAGEFVLVGTFSNREATRLTRELSQVGTVSVEPVGAHKTLTLVGKGDANMDALLEASWQAGARDAFIVRD
jgi:hypothetical protein